MKVKVSLAVAAVLAAVPAWPQNHLEILEIDPAYYCASDAAEVPEKVHTFRATEAAKSKITDILDQIGVSTGGFELKAANVDGAAAYFTPLSRRRFILYNEDFLSKLERNSETYLASWAVLAHEVGHHVHPVHLDRVNPDDRERHELEADLFAGHILARLSATEEQVKEIFTQFREGDRYPPLTARVAAAQNGFLRASASPVPTGRRAAGTQGPAFAGTLRDSEDNSPIASAAVTATAHQLEGVDRRLLSAGPVFSDEAGAFYLPIEEEHIAWTLHIEHRSYLIEVDSSPSTEAPKIYQLDLRKFFAPVRVFEWIQPFVMLTSGESATAVLRSYQEQTGPAALAPFTWKLNLTEQSPIVATPHTGPARKSGTPIVISAKHQAHPAPPWAELEAVSEDPATDDSAVLQVYLDHEPDLTYIRGRLVGPDGGAPTNRASVSLTIHGQRFGPIPADQFGYFDFWIPSSLKQAEGRLTLRSTSYLLAEGMAEIKIKQWAKELGLVYIEHVTTGGGP